MNKYRYFPLLIVSCTFRCCYFSECHTLSESIYLPLLYISHRSEPLITSEFIINQLFCFVQVLFSHLPGVWTVKHNFERDLLFISYFTYMTINTKLMQLSRSIYSCRCYNLRRHVSWSWEKSSSIISHNGRQFNQVSMNNSILVRNNSFPIGSFIISCKVIALFRRIVMSLFKNS